jgi:large subunit ribosomal protein L6
MSRIGKKPIAIPKGVTVKIADGAVEVQGPKGKLRQQHPAGINFELAEGRLTAMRSTDDPELGKYHGLARSLVANAVAGVTDGFKRELDIVGVGYRAEVKGKQVIFALGYSHAVVFDIQVGIDVAIEKQTHITVTGVDRQLVGQVAANIRRLRKPDPYKQKGVRYTGEVLKKKAGKTGAKARTDSAAPAQANFRHERSPAAERVPKRLSHLRAGHRRPERADARLGIERRSRRPERVRERSAGRKSERGRGDRESHRRAIDRKGHHARRIRSERVFVPWPDSRRRRRSP